MNKLKLNSDYTFFDLTSNTVKTLKKNDILEDTHYMFAKILREKKGEIIKGEIKLETKVEEVEEVKTEEEQPIKRRRNR